MGLTVFHFPLPSSSTRKRIIYMWWHCILIHIFDCVRPWQGPLSILVFQLYSSALLLAWAEICPLSLAMFLSGWVACNLSVESTQSLSQITNVCPIIILSPKMGQPIPQKCWYHCTAQSDGKTQKQSDNHLFLHWTCRCSFGSFILFWDGVLFIVIVKCVC